MKTYLIFALIIVAGLRLMGQVPGFNLRTTCEFPNTQLYKLLVDNDTIVGLGTTSDSVGNVGGIVLMKFDTFGNVLIAKLLQDSLIGPNPLFLRYGSFLKTPDGGYIMNVNTLSYPYPVIIKIDSNFEIEFIKFYADVEAYNFSHCRLNVLSDGYLLHGSRTRNIDNREDGFVRKINFAGEPIWHTILGGIGSTESAVDMYKKNDSTYVAAMVSLTTQDNVYSSLITLGKNGNVTGTWNSELEPEIGYLRKILSADEDGYLLYGLRVVQLLPPNNTKLVMSTLSKLDSDYNIEKAQHYGKKVSLVSEIMFYNFEETIDGNYIAAGRTSMSLPNNGPSFGRGWLMKFSPEGDSIWSRQDTSDVLPVHYLNQQRLGGVGVLSSGSIVAGGYVTKVEDNSSYIWLIKTTNDGCIDTLYCGLVSATEAVPQGQVSVYPNPASEVVNIAVMGSTGRFEVFVHDATGRLHGSYLSEDDGTLALQVAHLRTGIYYVSIKLPDGQILYKKASVVR